MFATEKKVPFLDLRVPVQEREELLRAIDSVLTHGRLILGPEVLEFEEAVAKTCQRTYAVGMNSGTDALFLGLKALNIGPGDEVITTALSWVATANAIAMTGATIRFADIGEDLNIDPESVQKLINHKTRAIVPVHYTGKICDMQRLAEIASQHDVEIIEDAAQAFGSLYYEKPAGSFGKIACFSMNPMKVFAACGEAGVVLTDDKEIQERLNILRYNGTINKETCIATSLNGRLDTIQAAVLLCRLKNLNSLLEKRRKIASFYNSRLPSCIAKPIEKPHEKDVYYTYTIRVERRDELKAALERQGIETKIQHPYLMSQQPIYQKYQTLSLPRAEKYVKEILCLPIHEKMEEDDLEYVANCLEKFF